MDTFKEKNKQVIDQIRYRINTASKIVGNGENNKAFDDLEYAIESIKELEKYKDLGSYEEIYKTMEKMKPKRPINKTTVLDEKEYVGDIGQCPTCGNIVTEDNCSCDKCYQVLNWSIKEE